ncbi:MAG: DUF3459 domain-containing protein, partial [Deltaproteobacteria bacterium]|nr:DUF3459 domain-containing protein [Deltaproteobacteria bacterium]
HEVVDLGEEVLDDPVWMRSGGAEKGRDGCRVPLPWTRGGPSFGFGSGEPWLPQPENFGAASVEAQAGVEGSTLELYRRALLRRQRLPADSELEWLDSPEQVLAYRRGDLRCWLNLGNKPVELPAGKVILASAAATGTLPGNAAVWLED